MLWPSLGSKVTNYSYPTNVWRSDWNITKMFAFRKKSLAGLPRDVVCVMICLAILSFNRTPVCDGRTDRQTRGHRIHRANIASHGNTDVV